VKRQALSALDVRAVRKLAKPGRGFNGKSTPLVEKLLTQYSSND